MNQHENDERPVQHPVQGERGFFIAHPGKPVLASDGIACEQESGNNGQERPTAPADYLQTNKVQFGHANAFIRNTRSAAIKFRPAAIQQTPATPASGRSHVLVKSAPSDAPTKSAV